MTLPGAPAPIPEDFLFSLNEDLLNSGRLQDVVQVLRDMVKAVKGMYTDMADAINVSPEYAREATTPTPAEGRFLTWEVESPGAGEPTVKLLYNNNGTVEVLNRSASTEQQGMVELATDAECQSGTAADKVVTPKGLRAGVFPPGTKMAFFQATAPTGWTQDETINDKVLRAVSSAGGGNGGNWTFSGVTVGGHALTAAELPEHHHSYNQSLTISGGPIAGTGVYEANKAAANTTDTGSGQEHTHSLASDGNWRPAYIDVIICTKD